MKVCLVLDLDDTVFNATVPKASQAWYVSKDFWLKELNNLKTNLETQGHTFELAIITAKPSYDDICVEAQAALHQFMDNSQITLTGKNNKQSRKYYTYVIDEDLFCAYGAHDFAISADAAVENNLRSAFHIVKNPFSRINMKEDNFSDIKTILSELHIKYPTLTNEYLTQTVEEYIKYRNEILTIINRINGKEDNSSDINKMLDGLHDKYPTLLNKDNLKIINDTSSDDLRNKYLRWFAEYLYLHLKHDITITITCMQKLGCLALLKNKHKYDKICIIDDQPNIIKKAIEWNHGGILAEWKQDKVSSNPSELKQAIRSGLNQSFNYLSTSSESKQLPSNSDRKKPPECDGSDPHKNTPSEVQTGLQSVGKKPDSKLAATLSMTAKQNLFVLPPREVQTAHQSVEKKPDSKLAATL